MKISGKTIGLLVALSILCFVPAGIIGYTNAPRDMLFREVPSLSAPKDMASHELFVELAPVEIVAPRRQIFMQKSGAPTKSEINEEPIPITCTYPRPLMQGSGSVIICE